MKHLPSLPARSGSVRAVLTLTFLACLALTIPRARAEANYVYHERTGNDVTGSAANTCGGAQAYVPTLNPSAAQSYLLRWKTEYQFWTDTLRVYYTTDGSTPSGAFGVGSGTTLVVAGAYQCTFTPGSVVDVCNATIPAQPAGTIVKYIISAWHSGGGLEIFANGPGTPCGCGTPTSTAAQATVFQYTVGSTTDLYWDINGATAGAGGATPTGTWDGATANWSTVFDGTAVTGTWTAGRNAVFSAGSDATGGFTVTVSGTQTAGGMRIEEGTVTLASGTVSLGAGPITIGPGATLSTDSSLRVSATAGSVMTINGGTARSTNPSSAGSFVDVDQVIVLGAGGGTLSYTVAGVLNIVQTTTTISGTGPLRKEGAGILAIASPCGYSGATIINDGTLRVRTASATEGNRLPPGTDVIINSPGVFDPGSLLNNLQQVNSVNGNGNITFSASSCLLIAGDADSTITGAISDGTAFGRLSKRGAGTLTLSGLNTYDGRFTNDAGTTTVTASGTLCGPVCDVYINGGVVNLSNATQTIENLSGTGGTINLGPGHVLITDPVGSTTFSGKLSGPGGFTKSNLLSGATVRTLTLSGPSDYDGNTLIGGGKILVASATALGSTNGYTEVASGAEVLFDGSTVTFTCAEPFRIAGGGAGGGGAITIQNSATPTLSGPVTLTGGATITVSSSASGTFSHPNAITALANQNLTLQGGANAAGTKAINGVINLGSGGLTKLQGGEWILAAENIYNGLTAIGAGTLVAASNDALGAAAGGTIVSNGAALGIKGNIVYSTPEPVSITGTGVSSAGAIVNQSGNNSFAGPVTLSGNASIGATSGSLILGGDIGGAFDLTKVGAGTLVLSGNNSHVNTLVSAGTLRLSSSTAGGSGTITVNAAGTLASAAAIANPVLLSGTIAPGASPGTFTTGSETWNGGGSYAWEINDASGSPGADPGWDLLVINGTLTIAATPSSKFNLNLASLTLANAPGDADNFDNTQDYTWTLATATGGISGFDAAAFNLVTAGFSNPLGAGLFVLETAGNDLRLRFVHAPTISCPAAITQSTDPGVCTAAVSWTTPTTGTAPVDVLCKVTGGALPINLPVASPYSFPKGTTTVSCTATNLYGTDSCGFSVTVNDTEGPVINCGISENLECGLGWGFTVPIVTDNCDGLISGSAVPVSTETNFICGAHSFVATRIWEVTDSSANTTYCTQVVTVVDHTPPTVTSCPGDLTVTCLADIPAPNPVLVTATDPCNDSVPTVTHLSDVTNGVCPKLVTRTYRVTDACSNSTTCVQTFTVSDSTPPTITCPPDVSATTDPGQCTASGVSLGTPLTSDNCAVASVTNDAPAAFPLGSTVVTWTATDECGNTAACAQTVTVTDTEPPVVDCSTNRLVTTISNLPVSVTYTVTATDNCDTNLTVICVPPSGSVFPVGVSNVTCYAVGSPASSCVVPDNGSGTATLPPAGCEYRSPDDVFRIIDGLPPGTTVEMAGVHKNFVCPATPGGVCSFAYPVPGSICYQPGGSLGGEQQCSDSALEFTMDGTGTLAGYHRVLALPVSFETHTAPRVNGQPVQSFDTDMFRLFGQVTGDPDFDLLRVVGGTDFGLPSPGHTTLRQQPGGNWAVDSFFDITYRIDFVGRPGGPFSGMSGSTTGTIRMQTGNPAVLSAPCTFTVTVSNIPPPTFTCPPDAGVQCEGDVPPPDFAGGTATSHCDPSPVVTHLGDVPSGGCPKTILRTYQVSDACGYTLACTQTITVNDTVLPSIDCPPDLTVYTSPGATNATNVSLGTPATADNCGVASVTNDAPTSFPVGTTTVTWTVTDGCSNSATCVQQVTVNATLAPPSLTDPPQNTQVQCGSNATFTVVATGSEPLAYQWFFNDAPIGDATNTTLEIAGATFANAGAYTVTVTNLAGAVTSAPVTLTVVDTNLPVIVTQPESRTNLVGTPASFTVVATSCSPLSYQWYHGANPLPDETNATLTLPSVQLADGGGYTVEVSNAAGTVPSATAILTVNRPPVALDDGAATGQDRPVAMAAAKLLHNDSDPDGDPLTLVSVSAASLNGGSVALVLTDVVYTPPTGFIGVDRFTYTISDGRGGTASAEVEVFVASGSLPSLNQVSLTVLPQGVLVRFAGIPGRYYDLQRTTNLVNWLTLANLQAPLHGIIEYLDTNPPQPMGLYRTVAP